MSIWGMRQGLIKRRHEVRLKLKDENLTKEEREKLEAELEELDWEIKETFRDERQEEP